MQTQSNMKFLPHTQKTIYPLNSSCVIIPFEVFHYWLGLVIIKGSFLVEYLYPEVSGNSLDGLILRKGDKHHADVGDFSKREIFYLQDRVTPYSKDHPYKYTALEEGSSYICFHQVTKFGPEFTQHLNEVNEWPYPNVYDSSLLTPNKSYKFNVTKDSHLYVVDGSIKINGKIKNSNEWLVASSDKEITIEAIEKDAVIAFLK